MQNHNAVTTTVFNHFLLGCTVLYWMTFRDDLRHAGILVLVKATRRLPLEGPVICRQAIFSLQSHVFTIASVPITAMSLLSQQSQPTSHFGTPLPLDAASSYLQMFTMAAKSWKIMGSESGLGRHFPN